MLSIRRNSSFFFARVASPMALAAFMVFFVELSSATTAQAANGVSGAGVQSFAQRYKWAVALIVLFGVILLALLTALVYFLIRKFVIESVEAIEYDDAVRAEKANMTALCDFISEDMDSNAGDSASRGAKGAFWDKVEAECQGTFGSRTEWRATDPAYNPSTLSMHVKDTCKSGQFQSITSAARSGAWSKWHQDRVARLARTRGSS